MNKTKVLVEKYALGLAYASVGCFNNANNPKAWAEQADIIEERIQNGEDIHILGDDFVVSCLFSEKTSSELHADIDSNARAIAWTFESLLEELR